jgi:DNA adenine methylase
LVRSIGGERRLARRIVEHFTRKIGTYFEPFLGGGSALY